MRYSRRMAKEIEQVCAAEAASRFLPGPLVMAASAGFLYPATAFRLPYNIPATTLAHPDVHAAIPFIAALTGLVAVAKAVENLKYHSEFVSIAQAIGGLIASSMPRP